MVRINLARERQSLLENKARLLKQVPLFSIMGNAQNGLFFRLGPCRLWSHSATLEIATLLSVSLPEEAAGRREDLLCHQDYHHSGLDPESQETKCFSDSLKVSKDFSLPG